MDEEKDEITEETETETETEIPKEEKPRDINILLDLPYSEMTEEEINLVIEFKAQVKANEENYLKQMEEIRKHFEAQIQMHNEEADRNQALLDELTAQARELYRRELEKDEQ